MTNRDATIAILNYRNADRIPIVHFGYWLETLDRWRLEGHLTVEEAAGYIGNTPAALALAGRLGFDYNYQSMFFTDTGLRPPFESRVIEVLADGSRKVLTGDGVVILQRDGAGSIPSEVAHLLVDRASWEEHYLPRLQFEPGRVNLEALRALVDDTDRENPVGLQCGSLFGQIRNWLGVAGAAYLCADDEDLFTEIIDTVGDLCYECTRVALTSGAKFDFAHFWEDICFRNGPLISPHVFARKVGPHYRRITELVGRAGINIVSLDCDGLIDHLVPVWVENGVNTMFPIEVGAWGASIAPWRAAHGRELRGVGGVNKLVFAQDRAAIDAEIERLKPLVDLGGYLPCPDHGIQPGADFDLVRYYCERMRAAFC